MEKINIKRKIVIKFINCFLSTTHFFKIKRKLLNFAGFRIGKNTKIVGPIFITSDLEIGDDCWIGREFSCYGNGSVKIGNNCDIAPNVSFLTGGHKIGNENRRAGEGESYNIVIEDAVWIGSRATVIKNIVIGKASVVAACACVVNNVKANTLVGGVPAKEIKKL